MLQAILFDRKKFNKSMVEKYLSEHNHKLLKGKKLHYTEKYIRARIAEPNKNMDKFIKKTNVTGVKYIIQV